MGFLKTARAGAFVAIAVAGLTVHGFAAEEAILLRRAHPTLFYSYEAYFEEGRNLAVTMWDPVQLLRKTSLPYAFVFTCSGRQRADRPTRALVDVPPNVDLRGAVYLAAFVQKRKAWDGFLAGLRAETAAITPETCADFVTQFPSRFVAPDPPIVGDFQAPMCIQVEGRPDDALEARTEKLRNGHTVITLAGTGQSRQNCAELEDGLGKALRRGAPRTQRIDIHEEVEETLALGIRSQLGGPVVFPPGSGSLALESLDGRAIFSRWTSRTRTFRLGVGPRMTSEETSVLDVAHFVPEHPASVDFDGFARAVARSIEPSRDPVGIPLLARTLREHAADLGEGSFAVLCDSAKPDEATLCTSGSCAPIVDSRELCAGVRSRLD